MSTDARNIKSIFEDEAQDGSVGHHQPSRDFLTPDHLSLAASTGDAEIVDAVLRAGCSPSNADALGETALHHAARLGLVEIVRLLVGEGAALDARNRSGRTALELADEYGQTEAVSALSELGAAVPRFWQYPRLSETIRFLRFEPLPAEIEPRLRDRLAALADLQVPIARAVLRAAVLPFYEDTTLIAVEDPVRRGPRERFVLMHAPQGQAFCSLLTWVNERIYEWNDRFGIQLSDDYVAITYLQFFFCFVRGQLGRFQFVERMDDLDWSLEAGDADRARVAAHLQPVRVTERTTDYVRLHGVVLFKNALFRTDAVFALRACELALKSNDDDGEAEGEQFSIGQGKLLNEDLLEESLPVQVSGPPGLFG
jgi:hypothetical protein